MSIVPIGFQTHDVENKIGTHVITRLGGEGVYNEFKFLIVMSENKNLNPLYH